MCRRISLLAYGILKLGEQCFASYGSLNAGPRFREAAGGFGRHARQDTARMSAPVEDLDRSGHAELRQVLRLAAFREYTISRSASGVATGLLQALILWQVYAISSSTLSLGIVGLVAFFAALISSVIGGAIVDTYDRRTILFASQVVPALGSVGMLVAIASGHVNLEMVYGLVLVTGLAAALEYPARQSILPAVVPRHLFARALTVNATAQSLTSVTGPAVAGVLIASGGIGAAYVGHLALVVIAILSLIPVRMPSERGGGRLALDAIREGLAYVWHRPILRGWRQVRSEEPTSALQS